MPEALCGFNDGPIHKGTDLLVEYGPTILVDIGFDSTWKAVVPSVIPKAGILKVEALVDTGATVSCIDDNLAKKLNLPKIDERPIGGVGGELMASIYLAQIHVISLGKTIYGDFAGVHLEAGGQLHKALLGRTFLQSYTMIYEGKTGTVKIKSA